MNICPLRTTRIDSPALIGGKALSLSRLLAGGLPVPDGFVITTDAYSEHAERTNLLRELAPFLDHQDYRGAAKAALHLLAGTPLAPDLESQIVAAWKALGSPKVAVRSSATAEDWANASFAGQHDSFLDRANVAELIDAVRFCWASLWSERAVRYRAVRGISPNAIAMAVVVQQMVPASAAGVIFTVDPLTQSRDHMLLEVVPGLGEALVSGRVRGETCSLERKANGIRPVSALPHLLDLPQIEELARLSLQIEADAGSPQDIEFAVADGNVFILQARAITTLGEPVPEPPPLSYMDRRVQILTLERYTIAPRPLDNLVFVRMVGAAVYAAQQFGLVVNERDFAEFRRTLWHQQYRFPRCRLSLRLFLHPLRSFGMLRTDWLTWWEDEPRRKLTSLSVLGDLSSCSDSALFERTETLLASWTELTNRRFYAVSSVDAERFLQWLVTLAVGPKAAPKTTGKLLSGIAATPTSETNNALWELSRIARRDPAALAAIREDKWSDIATNSPFGAALADFFARFGHRESGGFYLSLPTWRHDPTAFRQLLRSLVETDRRPNTPHGGHLEARALVEQKLNWFPWLRRQFVALLAQVRALHLMREESHFDLTRPLDALQTIVAELSRRLRARGLIAAADDVFYLTFDEVRLWLLSGPPSGCTPEDFIARRRATYRLVNARWQRNRPKAKLTGDTLIGTSGGPGRVRGVARIILDETEFKRLHPGEILVCPHSNPSWTPLFLTAIGVVSETGGAASHAAIVAREYGLPAVLAVTSATQLIRDGEMIEVDGDSGRVTLIRQK